MLDLRKMECPIPYTKCKEILESKPEESLSVIVSDELECMNLKTLANTLGYVSTYDVFEDGFKFTFKELRKESKVKLAKNQVLSLTSDLMGSGESELGSLLMKNFLMTLSKSEMIPNTIVALNRGVLLALKDSATLLALKELENRGTQIYLCKTCLDYYGCLDQVGVGNVSNMVTITEFLMGSDKVISM